MDSIRQLETQVIQSSPSVCTVPTRPGSMSGNDYSKLPEIMRLHVDILVAAMACDLTRVGTVQLGGDSDYITYSFLGHTNHFHAYSHLDTGDGEAFCRQKITEVNQWYSTQMAYLIQKMKSVAEGNGNMFDNSVVMRIGGLGKGWLHDHVNIDCVMAGSCGGYFRTGRFLNFSPRQYSARVLVSIANAMGLPITTYGEASTCPGPMPGLR